MELARAASVLGARYRAGRPSASGASPQEHLAYATVRAPATHAALGQVLQELRTRWPALDPHSALDLGAGPGTSAWAATDVFPELEQVTCVEHQPGLVRLGRRVCARGRHVALRQAVWKAVDLRRAALSRHDLVLAAYTLGELDAAARRQLVGRAWRAAAHALVLVEPGTPAGFDVLRVLREDLVGDGAHVVAPCPHAEPCPLAAGDWCHFAARVQRSAAHRRAKGGRLGHEDEKFAYLVLARQPVPRVGGRILRHPRKRSGHVHLELCTPAGQQHAVVSKKDGAAWRRVRQAAWGDAWDDVSAS